MSNTIIKTEQLGKLYRLGEVGTGTISHDLNRWIARIRGKEDPFAKVGESNDRTRKGSSDYVWALQDVNFEVKQGEVLGIIGRNGAGKSTLLKLLSKTTAPTTGRISVRGRIASLLEVGTGFHPEMTGKENIYLNGAILGMTRREIRSKFDEIVEFAGVERYVDTPVKRYSSGMYVRLAFAVAAHLEPEILIVDEVLAVGDAEFQKKCLGKMKDVSVNEGRTVLFVSHNMAAVKQLCSKGLVLSKGTFAFTGTQQDAVAFYQSAHISDTVFKHNGVPGTAPGNHAIRVLNFVVQPGEGNIFSISSGLVFNLKFYNHCTDINLDVTFELRNADEIVLFCKRVLLSTCQDSRRGIYEVNASLSAQLLNAGNYHFKLYFGQEQRFLLFSIDYLAGFEILNEATDGNYDQLSGVIRPDIPYRISFENYQL